MSDGLVEKNKGGSPNKFNPERVKKILAAIQRSATYELAANYAGVCYSTFRNWMKEGERLEAEEEETGEEINSKLLDFYRAVKEAEGVAAIVCLGRIDKAAEDGQWQAAAWKLERRYPQMYGRTVQEIQGKDGAPIEYANLTTEERLDRIGSILDQARARRAVTTDSTAREGTENVETTTRATDTSVS